MLATKEQRSEITRKYSRHEKDTGSPEVQIALLTERINSLTDHFRQNPKDFAGRRGMLRLVSRRRSLLDYLRGQSSDRYNTIIGQLNIRK